MSNEWLKHLARLYLPVYQCETGNVRFIYAGYSSIKRNYYSRLLFNTNEYSFSGRKLFSDIPALVNKDGTDLVICEISPVVLKYFQKNNGYIIPEWTTTRIDIDRPMNEICHRNISDFSNVLRRIRKYNLTYEILTGLKDFEYFNEKIYIPYISKRYGDEALIDDLKKFWNSSPSPVIMAVKEEGIIVGAALIRITDESVFMIRVGLLDGNDEYRLHGVIGALYYFSIVEGQLKNCKYLDLGGTRPFLTDGLTKFKMGLGATFIPELSSQKEYLWLAVNENSSGAKDVLARNPFMHVDGEFNLIEYK
jgi:hypothetical protein